MAIQCSLGRLHLDDAAVVYVPRERERHGIEPLLVDEIAVLHFAKFAPLHKDPHDRMLVCQALTQGLASLAADDLIRQYPVRTVW